MSTAAKKQLAATVIAAGCSTFSALVTAPRAKGTWV
jgi:hypothetical protein